MASAVQAIDLQNDRIAGITLDVNLRRSARRTTRPTLAWFETRLLVGRRA